MDALSAGEAPNIIIDAGSALVKAGLAGDDLPRRVFPSVVGSLRQDDTTGSLGIRLKDRYVGNEATCRRGVLKLSHPIHYGHVDDKDAYDALLKHTCQTELGVNPRGGALIVTEPPLARKMNREWVTQHMFESLEVMCGYIVVAPVGALYASGRTTGAVLDVGYDTTVAVPIYEGYSLPHAILKTDLASRTIDDDLRQRLDRAGHVTLIAARGADQEVLVDVKEQLSYCASSSDVEREPVEEAWYTLPDGQRLRLGRERFMCTEGLFNPAQLGLEHSGIHTMFHQSVMKCDPVIRQDLFNATLICGGGSLTSQFVPRFEREVAAVARENDLRVKLIEHPGERMYLPWLGCSILASLSTFGGMWMTKPEYDEQGPALVHRKCF